MISKRKITEEMFQIRTINPVSKESCTYLFEEVSEDIVKFKAKDKTFRSKTGTKMSWINSKTDLYGSDLTSSVREKLKELGYKKIIYNKD
ncbi:MAG: hypothetical protein ACOCTT_01040 [archaeon]